jgi:hypothetical protein
LSPELEKVQGLKEPDSNPPFTIAWSVAPAVQSIVEVAAVEAVVVVNVVVVELRIEVTTELSVARAAVVVTWLTVTKIVVLGIDAVLVAPVTPIHEQALEHLALPERRQESDWARQSSDGLLYPA